MLRIVLFSSLFFLNLSGAFTQNISFEDNFDDNSKGWYFSDVDKPEVTRKISGGKYYIHHKNSEMSYWTLISLFSNPTKPFVLETNIVQTEGGKENGFGLLIAAKGSKYFYFLIHPAKQSFRVYSEQNGQFKTYNNTTEKSNWVKNKAILKGNQSNNLKVVFADGRIKFVVNETEVYSSGLSPYFTDLPSPNYWGIVTCDVMKLEIDNYIFRQDNPKMNVVPDLPKLSKVSLGTNVNTKYTEKWPYVAPDGKTLFFDVEGDPENIGKDKTDDIYYSVALTDSTWDKRKAMGSPLNNDWPNCVISATPDNNTLYLMHTYNEDGSGKAAGFSMSTKTETGWSVPVDLKVKNYYNRSNTNEFCFSPDRKVLLMTIERDDTYGGKDIYVSFLQEDGSFSEPKNAGNAINTFAGELSPFMAADGITLYYSTYGLPGYGNADIHMTRRLDSTWTNWSTPLNMGPDINSKAWDAYYSIPASGKFAYVVSEDGSIEESLDLYRIRLPQALKPQPVVLVYGKVLNSKTKEPLESNINYNILATNKEIGIATSNVKEGTYKIVLPAGEVYSFLAKKNGFYSVSENIDLSKLTEYKEIEKDLYLAPLEVGETIRLNNLFFDTNKSDLRNESFAELDRVVKVLNDNPNMTIEIGGHTDNVGNDIANNKLSEDRAASVRNYLLEKGINGDRIVSKGYGKAVPVADNATEEGRQTNRRVEFSILKK